MTLSYLFRVDLQQLVHRSAVFLAIELQPKNVRIPLLLGVAVVPGKLMEAQAEQHVLQKKMKEERNKYPASVSADCTLMNQDNLPLTFSLTSIT